MSLHKVDSANMLAGHRWERDFAYLGYKCVPLPIGGVESHQWCVGCNCRISDLELYNSRLPVDDECSLQVSLDMLAHSRGYRPVEAGTLEEYKLKLKPSRDGGIGRRYNEVIKA